jgi:uncharacterized protein YdeI (YjbR/CyaY-like superfamily)
MKILPGILHDVPDMLKTQLKKSPKILENWNELTEIARNEFICWITMAKKVETQEKRLGIALDKLEKGEKRPCCWPGCPHRNPKAKKWFK